MPKPRLTLPTFDIRNPTFAEFRQVLSVHGINIDQLSPEQQLEVAHYIYQSLASTGRLLSKNQLAETKQRARQAKQEPDSTLSSDEMWRKVKTNSNPDST